MKLAVTLTTSQPYFQDPEVNQRYQQDLEKQQVEENLLQKLNELKSKNNHYSKPMARAVIFLVSKKIDR